MFGMGLSEMYASVSVVNGFIWGFNHFGCDLWFLLVFCSFFGRKLGKNHSKSFYCCEMFKLGYLMIFDYILILYMIDFCYSQSLFPLHVDCDLFSEFSNKIISMLFQWVWFSSEVELYMTDIKPECLPLLHLEVPPRYQLYMSAKGWYLKPYSMRYLKWYLNFINFTVLALLCRWAMWPWCGVQLLPHSIDVPFERSKIITDWEVWVPLRVLVPVYQQLCQCANNTEGYQRARGYSWRFLSLSEVTQGI